MDKERKAKGKKGKVGKEENKEQKKIDLVKNIMSGFRISLFLFT
jgi:hypothetical protein